MGVIKIPSFGGMTPALEDHLLPQNGAAYALNTYVYDGTLNGITKPQTIKTLNSTTAKVFRIPLNSTDTTNLGNATFMEFTNIDTDVLRAPVVGDTYKRYYWCSPTDQARYNTTANIQAGNPSYLLGILTPGTAPGVTPTGGSSTVTESRSYVYTWVSAYGEEGPPSPPTVASGKVDATWTITLTPPTTGEQANRNLASVRIYRTVTSSLGIASYFLIATLANTTTTYADTAVGSAITSNAQLQSSEWAPPPSDLQGWVSLPNGIIAGFRQNEIWFCEPYRPHAWPASYAIAVEYPIVGLGVIGQMLIVCTTGWPVAVSGVNPSSMTQTRIGTFEPCLSRGSIMSTPEGVYYASPNGLMLAAYGQVQNVTLKVIRRDRWLALTSIPSLRAARFNTSYYAFGSSRTGAFEPTAWEPTAISPSDSSGSLAGFMLDPVNPQVGIHALSMGSPVTNIQNDPWSGAVFVIQNSKLYAIQLDPTNPLTQAYKWRSKIFEMPAPDNLSAVQLVYKTPTNITQNPVANDTLVQTLGANQHAIIRFYANDQLVATREVRQSNSILRLPSGFKATYWQIEIESQVQILNITAGSTVKELGRA